MGAASPLRRPSSGRVSSSGGGTTTSSASEGDDEVNSDNAFRRRSLSPDNNNQNTINMSHSLIPKPAINYERGTATRSTIGGTGIPRPTAFALSSPPRDDSVFQSTMTSSFTNEVSSRFTNHLIFFFFYNSRFHPLPKNFTRKGEERTPFLPGLTPCTPFVSPPPRCWK